MAKAYLILCYHSVSDDTALQEYARLALPAIQSTGGAILPVGCPPRPMGGLNQRMVLIEFDSVEQSIAAHDSPGYQTALRALGSAAKRDVRRWKGSRRFPV